MNFIVSEKKLTSSFMYSSFYEIGMRTNLVSARGTAVQHLVLQPPIWTGEPYRKYLQEKMKRVSKNMTITMCKGTTCVKVENLPKSRPSEIYSTKNCIIVTNRGTSSRIL